MSTNGSFAQQEQYKTEQYPATSGAADTNNGGSSSNDNLSKDEVGWYFVEQYYTTLSKNPEKLHLFYGKRSQFVSGLEAVTSLVFVGRSAIQGRIRDLDFQDCKVRVTNVDSQASFDNIVIQVIGEMSNKSAEPKKFVQTFVLAQQPSGYFVLNDVFRYISEEEDDEVPEATGEVVEGEAGAATTSALVEDVEMPKPQATVEEKAPELDTTIVDKKLETIEDEPVAPVEEAPSTNGETPAEAEEAIVTETKPEEEIPTPEVVEKAVEEETKEPEKPAEPAPSPAISRLPSVTKPAVPTQPATPAKPLTWASRAAAAAGPPKPAVPIVAPKSTATPPAQARAAPPSTPAKPAQIQSTAAPAATSEKDKENNPPTPGGWQSVGSDHSKRQNRPQSISQAPPEKEGSLGYVRNVTEKVPEKDLREQLASFGKLVYFDINRSKNCAFVEYESPEGYQKAAAANPHKIAGEDIYVEPRRPKAGAYGGNTYNGPRGGVNQRGRGGFEQGRPGSQGGRGNFGQNRGRGGAPRGRGASQAANA